MLVGLQLLIGTASLVFWVRSPAVFDRVSWAGPWGLWEATSIYGDIAIVHVRQWPLQSHPKWTTFSFEDAGDGSEIHPVADCDVYQRGDPRGSASEMGSRIFPRSRLAHSRPL